MRRLIILGLVFGMVMVGNVNAQEKIAEEKGLVGYWRFDEGKGNTAKDLSGRGNDGKIYGAQWVKGKYGTALKFDGIDDYVDCGKDIDFEGKNKMTIVVWVYVSNPAEVTMHAIVQIKNQAFLRIAGGIAKFYTNPTDSSDGYTLVNSDQVLNNVGWYHIVGVYDGDAAAGMQRKIYVNGVMKGQNVLTGNFFTDRSNSNLGYRHGADYFSGIIGEVRIYDRALSAKEIKNHFEMIRMRGVI